MLKNSTHKLIHRVYTRWKMAIAVPPRRGEIPQRVFAKRLRESFEDHAAQIGATLSGLKTKGDFSELRYMFDSVGVVYLDLSLFGEDFSTFTTNLAEVVQDYQATDLVGDERFTFWGLLVQNFKRWQMKPRIQKSIDAFLSLDKSDLLEAIEEAGLTWDPTYREGIPPQVVQLLEGLQAQIRGALSDYEAVDNRLEAASAARTNADLVDARNLETLYHASIHAKTLYAKGFEANVPTEQAGLGGSQQAGGGAVGTSFTYDLFVAKEIARVLKELSLIAHGKITARAVLGWAAKDNTLASLLNLAQDIKVLRPYTLEAVGRGWRITNSEGTPVDANVVLAAPESVAWLYKYYLQSMRTRRYDPYVMAPHLLVRRLSRINPGSIGVVAVTVNMGYPGIKHLGGERELRVPPEAIVSVDKFIN